MGKKDGKSNLVLFGKANGVMKAGRYGNGRKDEKSTKGEANEKGK